MIRYRRLRTEYICFKKWMKYLKELYQYETPGLNLIIARRYHHTIQYSKYIQQRLIETHARRSKLSENVYIKYN